MVCWAMVGTAIQAALKNWGRRTSLVAGLSAAAVLFGVYHFAHSPPFNQPGLVLFLTLIGALTGLIYFLGRDIYATGIVHNFFGMVGVIGSSDLTALRQPIYPLYALAGVAVLVLIISHIAFYRPRLAQVQ